VLVSEYPLLEQIRMTLETEAPTFEVMHKPRPGITHCFQNSEPPIECNKYTALTLFAGLACVVRKNTDNPWTRGVIVTDIPQNLQSGDGLFMVMAVDYGDEFLVPGSDIHRYPNTVKNAYTDIPALAITCRLAGVKKRMDVKTMDERRKETSLLLRRDER
jgi:hypothetical protein